MNRALAACVAAIAFDACAASTERIVWDALHLGHADVHAAGEIERAAAAPEDSMTRYLAIAARATTRDDPAALAALEQAFREALDAHRPLRRPAVRTDFPVGFDRERLLTALSGALVDVGRIDFALDQLEGAMQLADRGDTDMLRQVVRIVGGARAKAMLERPSPFASGDEQDRLAQTLYFPDWEDLKRRSSLVPREQRTRTRLEERVLDGCGVPPAVAAYYLAHVPAGSPAEEARTDEVLDRAVRTTDEECFWVRMLAARALALRAPRAPELWMSLARHDTRAAYYGAAIARYAFAQHGRDFAPSALEWLAQRPHWYVEAELGGNLSSLLEGESRRDYWDMWQPRMGRYFAYELRARVAPVDARLVLEWLAAQPGRTDDEAWREDFLLASAANGASAETFALWLRLASHRIGDGRSWWIFQSVAEPAALPVLAYWKRGKSGDELESIERYERDVRARLDQRYAACCDDSRECLRRRVSRRAALDVAGRVLRNGAEMNAWLDGAWRVAMPASEAIDIRFEDEGRWQAQVRVGASSAERWQYFYGCWLPVEALE